MNAEWIISLATFIGVCSLIALVITLTFRNRTKLDDRLENLTLDPSAPPVIASVTEIASATLPKLAAPLMPYNPQDRTELQSRLLHAGFYHSNAMPIYLGLKMAMMVLPICVGIALGLFGVVPLFYSVAVGAGLSVLGMVIPSFYLDQRTYSRQRELRRALPDALDIIVICLEGGLSLSAAIRRVSEELRTAHHTLAAELAIVQQETHMGRHVGEALQQMADRTDLEELRSLSSVIAQSERLGAGLVKSMRVHADTLREKRLQHAEVLAQEASVKLLIPTVLFIFPCMFVVILAPAIIQVIDVLSRTQLFR